MAAKAEILQHFEEIDPRLADALRTRRFKLLKPTTDLARELVDCVISQQLSGKAADTLIGRFHGAVGTAKKFEPAKVLRAGEATIRSAGISGAKTNTVLEISHKLHVGTLNLNSLQQATDETVYDTLTAIKGIGPWTAEMWLIFSLGREDIFSLGDLGLRKTASMLYFKGRDASPDQLERLSRRWKPYRSYASLALWQVLDNR